MHRPDMSTQGLAFAQRTVRQRGMDASLPCAANALICRDEERLRPTHIHRPGGFRRVSHICGAEFQPCESGVPGALRVRDNPARLSSMPIADQARSNGSGSYRVDAHDRVTGRRASTAVAVLAIGEGDADAGRRVGAWQVRISR